MGKSADLALVDEAIRNAISELR